MSKNLVDVVRRRMVSCELSRYEIAKRSGIDQAALSRFIHGGSLRMESIEKLCPVLGLRLTLSAEADPETVRPPRVRNATPKPARRGRKS